MIWIEVSIKFFITSSLSNKDGHWEPRRLKSQAVVSLILQFWWESKFMSKSVASLNLSVRNWGSGPIRIAPNERSPVKMTYGLFVSWILSPAYSRIGETMSFWRSSAMFHMQHEAEVLTPHSVSFKSSWKSQSSKQWRTTSFRLVKITSISPWWLIPLSFQ